MQVFIDKENSQKHLYGNLSNRARFIMNFKRKDLENLFLCKNMTQTDWMTVVPAEPTFWEAKLNEQKKFAKRAKQVGSS